MCIYKFYTICFIVYSAFNMIKVIKNKSITGYYVIYDNSAPVDEIQGRLKAKRYAMKLAKKLKQSFILFLGESVDVEWSKRSGGWFFSR